MSRLILIQEDDYERQFRESMNYLSKYHDYPTRLRDIPSCDVGDFIAIEKKPRLPFTRTPIGKLVI